MVFPEQTPQAKLEEYVLEHTDVCRSMFEKRVPKGILRRLRVSYQPGLRRLVDLTPEDTARVLLDQTYPRLSTHFRRMLIKKGCHQAKNWWHTLDGVLIPLFLWSDEWDKPSGWVLIDQLTKYVLERCAQNYSQFLRELKSFRKRFRKWVLSSNPSLEENFFFPGRVGEMGPILRYWRVVLATCKEPELRVQVVLTLTQSRSTGLVDHKVMAESLDKFKATTTSPDLPAVSNPLALIRVASLFSRANPARAKISAGPAACFERTRSEGGQTQALKDICREIIDFSWSQTLIRTEVEPHRVATAGDVFSYCVEKAMKSREEILAVRVTVVNEPSKARVVTVSSYPYMAILQSLAHVLQPCLETERVRSGMRKTRHLWTFLREILHPEGTTWGRVSQGNLPMYGLSTDLEEATDFGSPLLARTIFGYIHGAVPESLRPLTQLCSELYTSERRMVFPDGSSEIKTRGWFMGDPLTKVLLTFCQEYIYQEVSLEVNRVAMSAVGDDLVALSQSQDALIRILALFKELGFKISEDDTYISSTHIYYCEECATVPQWTEDLVTVTMKRGETGSGFAYLDFPRLRLLIPTHPDVGRHSYTDVGRSELLGKETAWSSRWNPPVTEGFKRAVLIQRLLVPRAVGTVHPFLPVDLGGDGSYYPDPDFMWKYITRRSWSPGEAGYRVKEYLENSFRVQYQRVNRSGPSVHKYHRWMDIVRAVGKVPEEIRIYPKDDLERELLLSFRGYLVSPIRAAFTIMEAEYWASILRGEDPEEIELERYLPPISGASVPISLEMVAGLQGLYEGRKPLLQDWPYLVDQRSLAVSNYLNLTWPGEEITPQELWQSYLDGFRDFKSGASRLLLDSLVTDGVHLPEPIKKRLNMFFSSDPFILISLRKDPPSPGTEVTLVSRDRKLAKTIDRMYGPDVKITMLEPVIYLMGMTPPEVYETRIIEDAGAVLWADINLFSEGMLREEWAFLEERIFSGDFVRYRPQPHHPLSIKHLGGIWVRGYVPGQKVSK